MPSITEITTSYQRKVQLDQYEPITHTVELEVDLDEDDDPDEVYDEYSDLAEDMVERAIVRRLDQKALSESDDG